MHDVNREKLIAAFRGGDLVAFGHVWDWYLSQILRDIRRFAGDYDERQELLQVIRITIYQSRQSFVETSDLGGWIHGVCRRCCLRSARANLRLETRLRAFESMIDPLVDLESETEAAAHEYDRLCERVVQALDDLTPRQREIVERRIVHRQSVATVASDLHCAAGTVKATSHTALNLLRQRLQDTEGSDFGKTPPSLERAL